MSAPSAVGTKNVREVRELQFAKDGSKYAGQALEGYSGTLPYGFVRKRWRIQFLFAATNLTLNSTDCLPRSYGVMTTKEGFRVSGFFRDGKNQGEGIFLAPNGDTFYGQWNKSHKRHGKGLSIRASDATICVEEYDDGKLLKKIKRRAPAATALHWLPPLTLPGTAAIHTFSGCVPPGHAGHSMCVSKDGGLVVVFGGEVASQTKDTPVGQTQLTNDVYILDVKTGVWVKPATSGTVPPPMQGHTATLVGSKLVVIGGQLGGLEASSSVYALDIETGVWTCPIAKGLSFMNHTATLIGANTIWVLVQSSVFTLTLHPQWEWSEQSVDNRTLPRGVPRSFVNHTAVAVGKMIYVFGGKVMGLMAQKEGKKYERLSADVRILHTDSLAWEAPACTAPVVPASAKDTGAVVSDYSGFITGRWDVPRCEHTATLVGTKMYIIGGWTTSNPAMNVVDTSYFNDVQVLDVETLEWQYVPPQPLFIAPRSLHAAVPCNSATELWVYGGRNSAAQAINEWSILHLPQPAGSASAAAPASAVSAAQKKPAATATTAPKPAAVSASSSSSAAAGALAAASPADSPVSELIDESAAGSGSIMDAFLNGGQ